MSARAQPQTFPFHPSRIVDAIDERRLTTLPGNVPAELQTAQDLGPLAASTPVNRVQMMLIRSTEQETALADLLNRQQDRQSSSFHQWLTPAEFGARFGPSDGDLGIVTTWLAGHGFYDVKVSQGRTVIEFSGTAGAILSGFHTSLHRFNVGGEERIANLADPSIPGALAPVVAGIVSLNNLPRRRTSQRLGSFRRDNRSGLVSNATANGALANPEFTLPGPYYAIAPNDFATIYDVLPLWNAATPIDGTGQTIAVVGDTNFNPADFVSFRTMFNLPLGNTNSATGTQYLNIVYNGPTPTVRYDEAQADIDTQWAAAVAKGATIVYVASRDTETSLGIDLSAAYIVDNNLAGILTDSYSKCEQSLGSGGNAFYNSLWQQAAAQGITVVTASGDAGSAGCDTITGPPASGGLAVSGIASTPYNVAVGGTDFYAPNGAAAYFGSTNNGTTLASALSYIPETTWNDTCTNAQLGTAQPYLGLTPEQVCNSSAASSAALVQVSGSGGGASHGYAKPSWQTGAGVPSDGVRDVPDVSFFASKGRNRSFYVVCQQDLNADGKPCNAAAPYSDFVGYGGTGVTAPAFAGVLALVGQKIGARLGNANYALYSLAAQQVAAGTACNATGAVSGACIFHDVTVGTNSTPCVAASLNCVTTNRADAYGMLSAASAGMGYDETTGLGSVDVANLANNWALATFNSTSAVLTMTPQSIAHGGTVNAQVTVSAASGTPTGNVALIANTANGALGAGTLSNGSYAVGLTNLPGGSYGVRAHYGGSQTYAATDSNYVSVTVTPENSTTTLQPLEIDPITNVATGGVTSAPYGTVFYIRANVAGLSGQGIATGNVLVDDNGSPVTSGTFRLNSSGYTEAQVDSLATGTHLFTGSYTGDPSFNPSTSNTASLTIVTAPTTLALTAGSASISADGTVTLTATVGTKGYGYYAPSGAVTFYAGGAVLGSTAVVSSQNTTTFTDGAIAIFTLSGKSLPLGLSSLSATYAGDINYLPSASNSPSLTVTPPVLSPTLTVATALPAVVQPSGTIVFSATVSPSASGTVQFLVDDQNVGAPVALSGGKAQLSETMPSLANLLLPPASIFTKGAHTLTAVYSGSGTLSSSTSAATSFIIAIPSTASIPVITVNPAIAFQGTFVTVQVQIDPLLPVATGTAQLVLDGGLYGNALALTNGAGTLPLPTTTLQAGTHVVSVYYSGDANYTPSYAANTSLNIKNSGATPSAIALVNVPAQVQSGSPLLFNANVTPTSPVPTGILQLIVDGGNPGTPIALAGSSTVVALTTTGLAVGRHTLSAYYSGDSTYSFSTSPTVSFLVVAQVVPPGGTFTISPPTIAAVANPNGFAPPGLTFTLTPTANFNAVVTFSCTGMPSTSKCVFTPASVPLIANPVTTVLTFDLSSLVVDAAPAGKPLFPWLPVSCGIALSGIFFLRIPARQRKIASLLACLLLGSLGAVTGCGSGFHRPASSDGTYAVTVIASGGGVAQSATVNLTIR